MSHVFPVGIDLGTTNSAVAYLTAAGQTTMVRNELGDILTPSYVFFDDDATVVGRDAKKALSFARDRVVTCAKRDLGQPLTTDQVNGQGMPPEAIEAIILKSLGKQIESELGDSRAVITVPAFFDEQRRGLTLAAAEMANLNVLNIVNEPTAAALAFGEQLGYLASDGRPRDELNLMVFDLGGGTFDVTLLQIGQGEVRTLSTDGDFALGGIDWDVRMLEYVAQKFEDQFRLDFRDDLGVTAKVLQACEAAKQTLSSRQRAVVPVDFHDCHIDVSITRETFESLTEDLMERTVVTARHAAAAASLEWAAIDRVLLVGGSTRMPMVARRVIEMVGRPPDEVVNPDEAVARGAAIFAAANMKSRGIGDTSLNLRVVDVNSHSLGVAGIDQATSRLCNKILIPRNTPLPSRVTYRFVTKENDQQSVAIKVLEGESMDLDGCSVLGNVILRDLPLDLAKGHPIEVIFHCQENGRLEVVAKVADTDHGITVQLERHGAMSNNDIRTWQKAVGGVSAFDDLEPLLDKLRSGQLMRTVAVEQRAPPDVVTRGVDVEKDTDSWSHPNVAIPLSSSEFPEGEVAELRSTATMAVRERDISPIWLFVGAIVGALMLLLLIRLGLG